MYKVELGEYEFSDEVFVHLASGRTFKEETAQIAGRFTFFHLSTLRGEPSLRVEFRGQKAPPEAMYIPMNSATQAFDTLKDDQALKGLVVETLEDFFAESPDAPDWTELPEWDSITTQSSN